MTEKGKILLPMERKKERLSFVPPPGRYHYLQALFSEKEDYI